ncbi:MAG TPA: TlpA disulfide reductase family protein [Acidobacteriaceae bacterium]|nr:TlpA disulfide reductase family protein [Acidobacteriaceae bacterium]
MQISDGRTEWFYAERWHRYIEQPVSPDGPSIMVHMVGFGGELGQAKSMIRELEHLADPKDSNLMLQEETIDLNGQKYPCYVVHVSRQKSDRADKVPYKFERTLWIDKRSKVIRKVIETSAAYIPGSPTYRYPTSNTATTTTYPVVELNADDPVSEFFFAPPTNAKRVATLDPPYYTPRVQSAYSAKLLNMPAPAVVFVTTNGQGVSLAAYKGKPVLLDFWATWCVPCMESMPKLARLNQRLGRKGITVISIDEDADANAGKEFFARHNYDWQKFHDDHRAIQKAFEGKAIPLTLLIDQDGKIVFNSSGWDGAALRSAIATLGPQYAVSDSR